MSPQVRTKKDDRRYNGLHDDHRLHKKIQAITSMRVLNPNQNNNSSSHDRDSHSLGQSNRKSLKGRRISMMAQGDSKRAPQSSLNPNVISEHSFIDTSSKRNKERTISIVSMNRASNQSSKNTNRSHRRRLENASIKELGHAGIGTVQAKKVKVDDKYVHYEKCEHYHSSSDSSLSSPNKTHVNRNDSELM